MANFIILHIKTAFYIVQYPFGSFLKRRKMPPKPAAPPKAMAEKIRRRLRFPAVKADFIERYFLKMAVEAHHVFGKRLVVSASGAIFAYHLPQARIVLLLSQNNDVYGVNLVGGIYLCTFCASFSYPLMK